MNVPLQANQGDYYLAIRGWLPTEQFQTRLRFYLPNRYDFGFLSYRDISNEIIASIQNSNEYNPDYLYALQEFGSNFVFTQTFGSNASINYAGSTITSAGFGDFMNQYESVYNSFSTNTVLLATIQSSLKAGINSFVASDLKYILPPAALSRQRYTDPILFQTLWKSQLTPQYAGLNNEWGLGWNLGYAKQDTPFGTTQTAPSFYKIQDDYIFLRLNPEFNINGMDAGGKENYTMTRESTGTVNQYYCKLLLTSFGGNATTFIHNPIVFNPMVYRLTKLDFQWIDKNSNVITNFDAEWDMVVNFTEKNYTFTTTPMPYTPLDPANTTFVLDELDTALNYESVAQAEARTRAQAGAEVDTKGESDAENN
jgi:hypothetical protein